MFTMTKWTGLLLSAAGALLLSACGSLSTVKNGQTSTPVWPDAQKANPLIPGTQYPQLDTLRNVVPGISKLEVYRLIGHPQYGEGMAGVHEWDYVFKLPKGNSGEFVTCQFKQLFDDNMRAAEHFWRPEECAQLVAGVAQKPAAPPAPAHVASEIEISADFLFDFDSDHLSANAPAAINSKVVEALEKASNVEVLKVIGYTDRLGSNDYNLKLSMRRAMAVKNYLISQGIPAEAISAEGRGSTDPRVQCNQKERAALIACLKPNRRVLIQVVAH